MMTKWQWQYERTTHIKSNERWCLMQMCVCVSTALNVSSYAWLYMCTDLIWYLIRYDIWVKMASAICVWIWAKKILWFLSLVISIKWLWVWYLILSFSHKMNIARNRLQLKQSTAGHIHLVWCSLCITASAFNGLNIFRENYRIKIKNQNVKIDSVSMKWKSILAFFNYYNFFSKRKRFGSNVHHSHPLE